MKRLVIGILLLFLCLFPAGCWSQKEITKISIVLAGAIDLAEAKDQIILAVQVANPAALKKTSLGGEDGGIKPFMVAASAGYTLGDAERNLYKHITRPIFWQHMRVLVISEELARTKMGEIIDYLDRVTAWRRNMLLVVTPGKAKEALEVEPQMEKFSGQAIYELARITFKHSEALYPSNFNNFLISLSTVGNEPLLARLEVKGINGPETGAKNPDMGPGQTKMLQLSGSAVFKADKMVGWLNDEETKGLLWVGGKALNNMLVLKYPGSPNKEELITVLNQRISSKIKPELVGGKIRIKVAIGAKGRISGQSFTEENPSQTEKIKLLNRQYALAIERLVKRTLAKARELDSDIFGFGLAISREYPKQWKILKPKWDEEFRRLEVIVKVKATIRRMGLTTKPTERE